jgi:hypothetical protein
MRCGDYSLSDGVRVLAILQPVGTPNDCGKFFVAEAIDCSVQSAALFMVQFRLPFLLFPLSGASRVKQFIFPLVSMLTSS